MSINFCTLTGSTLDTFCGNSRQIILDRLLDEKYATPPVQPFIGTNNSSVSKDFTKKFPHLVRHAVEDDERPVLTFEQPFITVSAELMGATGSQQQEVTPRLDFVVASDLNISKTTTSKEVELSVNISDFTVS